MTKPEFRIEALVDFLDDAIRADHPLTERDLEGMMRLLAESGVRRVVWAYYGDGHGGLLMPEGLRDGPRNWGNCRATYRQLGNPLRVAVAAGHRFGLEVYAYFKPYETGTSLLLPEGSPEAKTYGLLRHGGGYLGQLNPFVVSHPGLRIQRRRDDHPPGMVAAPVCTIKLVKRNDAPTRLTADHLQIWTSPANYRYRQVRIPFTFTETVEPAARDVRDHTGACVTRCGNPVRVLTLSGFRLDDAYILVTTDFKEGPADFENTGVDILKALDAAGREIPGIFATGASIYLSSRVDFRQWGLIFDFGRGKALTRLDEPNGSKKNGIVAFTRGRNAYLPAALCETEPEVQAFWLKCLGEIVEAGVDGVDVREENHSTHTDEPQDYGFNPAVLALCRPDADLQSEMARVRGEAYTAFLRQAKQLLVPHGMRLRYHLNMDWFRPDPPASRALAYPANLRFDWRRWIEEGLLDEAVLRSYHHRKAMLTDDFGAEIVETCRRRGIPISFNHHVFGEDPWYFEEAQRVAADGRFAGLILYETQSFLRCNRNGDCRFKLEIAEKICRTLRRVD